MGRTRRVILKETRRDGGREKWSFAHASYEMGWKQILPPAFQLQQGYSSSSGHLIYF